MTLIEDGLEAASDPVVQADLLEARLAIADDLGTVHAHLQSALLHATHVDPLDAGRSERLRARAWLDALERFELDSARGLARLAGGGRTPTGLAAIARHGLVDSTAGTPRSPRPHGGDRVAGVRNGGTGRRRVRRDLDGPGP
jgi:hypothetical protein